MSNKIYINAGRESGIQISDVLRVMTEGTEIFDPETGALIGVSAGEVKGTVEVSVSSKAPLRVNSTRRMNESTARTPLAQLENDASRSP